MIDHLAVVDLAVHAATHMVHVVVHHGQRDAHGQHRYHGEANACVGHEAVGLTPVFHFGGNHGCPRKLFLKVKNFLKMVVICVLNFDKPN